MAQLHDAIKETGYGGKDLENYLVRLLFCLFAEDTGLFGENGAFLNYLHNHTKVDGSDLNGALTALFDTLNTDHKHRLKNLPEHLRKFPYINGALFEGNLKGCYFDEQTRNTLIECANLDWSDISPAIFGSLFQAIMHFDDEAANAKTKKRREFGAHYTSEENILKTINPLFMDDLRAEFKKCSKPKLHDFHNKLASLNFFDPACGCGNFLIIAYRELRVLELDVINAQFGNKKVAQLDVDTLIKCNVHQFHGIDIDDSAVHIATVAMWLVDHQMNLKVQQFGKYYDRIPLVKKANIVHANALQIDWQSVIKPKDCSFIMGNPPFVGSTFQTKQQKADCAVIFNGMQGAGVLDFVAAWHVKAARYIQENPKISVAFVSTNSICQGEQVGILWRYLLAQGIKIRFAYRTFKWSNEGRGVAAVHCIIVGFQHSEPTQRFIFDNENKITANNINPYLVDAPSILIEKRTKPICINTPEMVRGNQPTDGGHLLLSPEEKEKLLAKEAAANNWLRPLLGSEEFINGKQRWCLWLVHISPNELAKMPEVLKRVEAVKNTRLASRDAQARKLAERPSQFRDIKEPESYLLIPRVSSEQRPFIPIGFINTQIIAADSVLIIPNATLHHFGILTSTMHNAWMRAVCGRLESRYRYSAMIVYNNFPFPTPTEKQIAAIEKQAQAVLDARAVHENSTLADLYNPLTMPANLVKAHNELDKAVDSAYNYKNAKDDAARVAFLFEKYQTLVAPLVEVEQVKTKK
jgi:type II restriction/modification system DNA methylase subunit YeeA